MAIHGGDRAGRRLAELGDSPTGPGYTGNAFARFRPDGGETAIRKLELDEEAPIMVQSIWLDEFVYHRNDLKDKE